MKRDLHIAFIGTPEFAVPSLDILCKNGYNIDAVVTAPDKPSGRSKKLTFSAIKKYALQHKFFLLQPRNLKNAHFVEQLISRQINLIVVVAFRMLPRQVWQLPEFGTFNLHASLLPDYRGAAPINRAIINGEKQSGVSTFFIDEKIDTGKIIFQQEQEISENDNAGSLHDKLMHTGAELVLKTVQAIEKGSVNSTDQNKFVDDKAKLHKAPKIFMEDCQINWKNSSKNIYNFIRGLSPYPAAYTYLHSPENNSYKIKIFDSVITGYKTDLGPGEIYTDQKKCLLIGTKNHPIEIRELQLAGKKRLKIDDFLRGFNIHNNWKTTKTP